MLKKLIGSIAAAAALSACGHVDEYERAVHDWDPVYCYKTIGGSQCHAEPKHSDADRLINYYGPHPSRYDAPASAPAPSLVAPETVNYWVKDPEPIPRPMPKGELSDRPWLTEEGRAESIARRTKLELEQSKTGTRAFLRRINDAAAKPAIPAPDTEIEQLSTL